MGPADIERRKGAVYKKPMSGSSQTSFSLVVFVPSLSCPADTQKLPSLRARLPSPSP
jgi:hypothetical protein